MDVRIPHLPVILALLVFFGCTESDDGRPSGKGESSTRIEKAAGPAQEKGESPSAEAEPQGERLAPTHDHKAFNQRRKEREEMVSTQIQRYKVEDEKVLEAMRTVPRHAFVRPDDSELAYADRPLPIGHGQTISQPFIVGYMTEKMQLDDTKTVLEIGTGSAYQAAVAAEIAYQVYSIEILLPLGKSAEKRLVDLGYRNVTTKVDDGYFGWKEHGPFDAIIVTAASPDVPPPLVKQLKRGGRMIIPVGGPFAKQYLILVRKDAAGKVTSQRLLPVAFVPFTRKW